MRQDSASAGDQLRHVGPPVTGPRLAVLEWLPEHPQATADQIGRGGRDRTGAVSTQAVYDVVPARVEAGLVRWIESAGRPDRCERRTVDNHHHFVCRKCGRTEDVDGAVGAKPCLSSDADRGYELGEAEVVFWGVCSALFERGGAGRDVAADRSA